jgi:hypothetical protein
MADGQVLFGVAKQIIPPQARFFAQALLGDRTKALTQNDLTPEELQQLNIAIENSKQRLGKLNKGFGNVQYEDYPKNSPIRDTLGRFTYQIQPDGSVHVSDIYDFYNEARAKNVAKYEQENPVFKALDAGTLALSKALSGDIKQAAGTIGEAYIGRDGRPVDIRYDPSIFRLPPSVDNFQSPMYTDPFGNTTR